MSLDPRELAGLAGTFLGDIGAAARDELLADATLLEVPRARLVFPPDSPPNHVAFVLEGTARVYLTGPGHRQVTVRYARARSMVGTSTLGMTSTGMPVRITAVNDCSLIELKTETFARLQATNVQFSGALVTELQRRMEDVYRAFAAAVQGTMRERLAAALLDNSDPTSAGEYVARITQHELADALGTAREVVHRTLKELDDEGLLRTGRGEISILDPSRLVAEAGPRWSPTGAAIEEPDRGAAYNSRRSPAPPPGDARKEDVIRLL